MVSSVVIVSDVQLSDSVIHTDVSVLFQSLPRLGCHMVFGRVPHAAQVVTVTTVGRLTSPESPAALPPTPATRSVFSKSLGLFLLCRQVHFVSSLLDSADKLYHTVFLCLTAFPQCDRLQVHRGCCRRHSRFLLSGSVTARCIHVPHLYLFLCQ